MTCWCFKLSAPSQLENYSLEGEEEKARTAISNFRKRHFEAQLEQDWTKKCPCCVSPNGKVAEKNGFIEINIVSARTFSQIPIQRIN